MGELSFLGVGLDILMGSTIDIDDLFQNDIVLLLYC
jgi:hypothetical protein